MDDDVTATVPLRRLLLAGAAAGILFLVLDVVLNANPLARRLYAVYQPIARPGVNALAGTVLDLAYGLILAGLFARLRESLPGSGAVAKAAWFGAMVWFLRVFMRVAGEWIVTVVPASTHVYTLAAGLIQVLAVTTAIALLLPGRPARVETAGR